jgi:hypothetical protein
MKSFSIFAAVSDQGTFYNKLVKGIFYVLLVSAIYKDTGYSNPVCLLRCNSSLVGNREVNSLFHFNFSCTMTKEMKDYRAANNSNCHVTPDCESVNPQFLSQVSNLLPKSEQNSQDLGNVESSIAISSDANGSEISTEKIGNVEASDVTGCNMNGSDNNVCSQHNTVSDNHGITGISGTGHTINIYQYPKELIELLKQIKS